MAKHVYMYNSKNGDRKYNAMSISAMLAPFFTTGVFNGSFEVQANNTMALTVKEGHAYFSGGPVVEYDEPESVTVPPPGSLPRIDRIVIRRDDPERDGYLHYLQGAYSSNPTAPGITRENGIDDRVICQFRVAPGTVAITKAMVEDKRMDPNLCGYVAATVAEIDFNGIWEQWVALLQNLKTTINGVIDGSQYMLTARYDPRGTISAVDGIDGYVGGRIETLDPDGSAAAAGGISSYVEGFYKHVKTLWTGIANLNSVINIENVGRYFELVLTASSGSKYSVYKNDEGTAFAGGGIGTTAQAGIETNAANLTIAASGDTLNVTNLVNLGHLANGSHTQNYVGSIRKVESVYWGPLAT